LPLLLPLLLPPRCSAVAARLLLHLCSREVAESVRFTRATRLVSRAGESASLLGAAAACCVQGPCGCQDAAHIGAALTALPKQWGVGCLCAS
jgi:hypothetical protein